MRTTKFLFTLVILFSLNSCNENAAASENDINTASKFIRFCNNYQFDKAASLLVKTASNQEKFGAIKKTFASKSSQEMQQCKQASIIIHEVVNQNDSITTINYSMSNQKAISQQITLIHTNKEWLIQLP